MSLVLMPKPDLFQARQSPQTRFSISITNCTSALQQGWGAAASLPTHTPRTGTQGCQHKLCLTPATAMGLHSILLGILCETVNLHKNKSRLCSLYLHSYTGVPRGVSRSEGQRRTHLMDLSAESSPTALETSILGEWCRWPEEEQPIGCHPPISHGLPSPAPTANSKGRGASPTPSRHALPWLGKAGPHPVTPCPQWLNKRSIWLQHLLHQGRWEESEPVFYTASAILTIRRLHCVK